MKKIFALVLALICVTASFSQGYPITQVLGSDSTIVVSKGATQSRFVNIVFVDTTAANNQRIKSYPGAQIATNGGGIKLWLRNQTATAWIPINTGSGNNIYSIDGTLTGVRTLTGGGYPLTFTGLDKFVVSADSIRFTTGDLNLLLKTDSASISKKISYAGNYHSDYKQFTLVDKGYVDSVVSSSPAGTVTSIATNNATGITGGTITSTGTLAIDTALISTRLWRQKGIDSVAALINNNVSGIAGYVPKFSGTNTIDTSQLFQDGQNIGLGTTTPNGRLAIVDTGGFALKINYNSASNVSDSNAAIYAENNGLSSYVAIFNEKTTNNTGAQLPLLIESSLTTGTPQANMGTGMDFGTRDDANNRKLNRFIIRGTNPAAATYTSRAEFRLWDNGVQTTPYYWLGNGNMGLGTSTPDSNLTVVNGALFGRGIRASGLPQAPGTKALRIDASGTISYADTLIDAGGTVTSVATNDGTGITGGTITTSGTLAIDTALISTRAWRQKGIDSVAALANTKVGGTGIANYMTRWTGTSTVDTSQIFQNAGLIGIGTTSPAYKLDLTSSNDGYARKWIADDHFVATTNFVGGFSLRQISAGSGGVIIANPNATAEYARISATGLGVLTTPDSSLTVLNGTHLQRGVRMSALPSAPGTKALRINASGTISIADTLIDAGGTVTSVATNNSTGITGGTITTSGTLAIDTLLIATRAWRQKGIDSVQANLTSGLATKLNISDTSSMLSPYLRKIDTASLSNRINLKLNISDTASMLSPYLRSNVASATYVPQSRTITINGTLQDLSANRTFSVGTVTSVGLTAGTGISVSGSPVTGSGSMTVTNTAPDQTVVLNSGTGISISGTYPSFTITNSSPSSGGTVTSVGSGYGLSGGAITGSGTLLVDSATLSAYYLRRKDSLTSTNLLGYVTRTVLADSAAAIRAAAGTVTGSGTTNYIPKFTSSSAIGNSVMQESSSNIGVGGSPSGTYGKLSVFGGISIKDDNNAKLEIGRYSSGASNSYIKLGANSNSLRITDNADQYDILTLTNGGNLGLGVTPSAWLSTTRAFQLGYGAVRSFTNSANTYLENNNYVNSSGTDIYLNNGAAGRYRIADEQHIWYQAASGTAGNAITFTQAMTLDASGNLGVGNTSPSSWIDGAKGISIYQGTTGRAVLSLAGTNTTADEILGRLSFTNTATTNTAQRLVIIDGVRGADANSGYLQFYTANSGNPAIRMTITSGGNVGIGTTSPTGKLHSYIGDITAGNAPASSGTTPVNAMLNLTNNRGIGMYFGGSYSGSYAQWIQVADVGNLGVYYPLALNPNGGNVGIGTTSPNDKLTIAAGSGVGAATTYWGNGVSGSGEFFVGHSTDATAYLYNRSNTALILGTNNTERMRITSGGNVGIGTTNPGTGSGAKLEVVQGTSTNAVARLVAPSSKTSTTQEYPFYITTNEAWASNPFGFEFGLKGNSTSSSRIAYIQAMTVNSSNDGILALQPNGGNVGIGTQSPATILDVRQSSPAGDVLMTMANTSANAYSGILLKNSSLTDKGLIAWANASASSWASSLALVAIGSDPMVFGTSNTERMRITSGGYLKASNDGSYLNSTGAYHELRQSAQSTASVVVSATNASFDNNVLAIGSTRTSSSAFNLIAAYANDFNDLKFFVRGDGAATFSSNVTATNYITGGVANTASFAATGYSLTGSNAQSLIDLAGTWNTSGNPTAIKLNITNTASGSTSNLMDLQVGGTSQYKVDKAGNSVQTGTIKTTAGNAWNLKQGGVSVGGADGLSVLVDIDGTTYYLLTGYPPEPEPEAMSGPSIGYKAKFEQPTIKIKSDNQKIKDLENEIAQLKELIKSKIK
jgi:hypothetical protein